MALPPFLKRRAPETFDTRPVDAPPSQERTRARRRLIGAAVLLVLGVIAFPVLFESQPRPVPVNLPMAIPSPEGAAPLSLPSRTPRVVSGTIGEAAQAAGDVPAAAPVAAPVSTPLAAAVVTQGPAIAVPPPQKPDAGAPTKAAAAPAAPTPAPTVKEAAKKPEEPEKSKKAAERVAEKPVAKAVEKPVEKPSVATKPAPPAPAVVAAPKATRYVVQVGAYADDTSAKEARARVERLGLKTFTQDVDVQGARRIRVRVGPFETQDAAAKALATLKAGKLPGVVLTL